MTGPAAAPAAVAWEITPQEAAERARRRTRRVLGSAAALIVAFAANLALEVPWAWVLGCTGGMVGVAVLGLLWSLPRRAIYRSYRVDEHGVEVVRNAQRGRFGWDEFESYHELGPILLRKRAGLLGGLRKVFVVLHTEADTRAAYARSWRAISPRARRTTTAG